MKLFEYQGKDIFSEYEIPVPKSEMVTGSEEIEQAVGNISFPCVLKAQVLRGGRGKAGLIAIAHNKDEAIHAGRELFAHSEKPSRLLIEEGINIEKEIYLSITYEPQRAEGVVIACSEGGIEIEDLAEKSPEKIIKKYFDSTRGLETFRAKSTAYDMGLTGDIAKKCSKMLGNLYRIFSDYHAELVEINPLFITPSGELIAGDAKIILDDNGSVQGTAKGTQFEKTREYFESDAEYEAAKEGIPFLQFKGDIGLMCAGAGLTTTVYDLINYEGGTVANYLEFGGPNYHKAVRAMELCLQSDSKVILIVTFGTIARADVMAKGVVEAMEKLKPDRPIVTCIRGTNEEEAVRILENAGLEPLYDTEEAVRKAVAISKGKRV